MKLAISFCNEYLRKVIDNDEYIGVQFLYLSIEFIKYLNTDYNELEKEQWNLELSRIVLV